MKARQLLEHFTAMAPWFDRTRTVDRVLIGDIDKEVHKVLVTWMGTTAAVEYAAEHGFDMMIVHEPIFWYHTDVLEEVFANEARRESAEQKKKLIEDSGLVIIRNHDTWDTISGIGIADSLASFLGFEKEYRPQTPQGQDVDRYHKRYDIEPVTFQELANGIVKKTALIGQPYVEMAGKPDTIVSKIGIGTGCGCNTDVFKQMGCDAAVVCDDGSLYWHNLAWAIDSGFPVIRMYHGTSEEPGVMAMAKYTAQTFPELEVEHYAYRSGIRLVVAAE